jgi:ring-1,2-phenylacetyl-CoA epoxidase subunit PaaE
MSTFRNLDLTLAAVTAETSDAVTLAFADPNGELAGYTPGQFLTLNVEVNGTKHRRSYSLCTADGVDANPAVCVKRVEGGLVSNELVSNYKAGQTINLFTAIGNFVCQPIPTAKRHIVLIGAGSGITPLWSIAKAILTQEPGSYVSLIYGNRTEASIIFNKEIAAWEEKFKGHFRVAHTLTQPPAGWQGPTGRINGELVLDLLPHLAPLAQVTETRYYLCGPQAMAESVEHDLLQTGVSKKLIFRESFFSDNLAPEPDTHTPSAGEVFEAETGPFIVSISLDGKKYEVEVPVGETILQAALDQDIDMPYSCQAGLCTACRGKCLSGKVEMDETEGLVESEIKEGYVLLCVGHPRSANVVIEVG